MQKIVVLFVCIVLTGLLPAQRNEDPHPYSIVTKGYYGFIIPHRKGVESLINRHVNMFELSFDRQTLGNYSWEAEYNEPNIGLSYLFADLGNPKELGYITGIYPYIDLPLIKRKLQFLIRLGLGVGYVSRPFNLETNHKNIFIGSYINGLANITGNVKIPVCKRLYFLSGLSFTHLSNGAYKMPNLGLNIASMYTGISYYIGNNDCIPGNAECIIPNKKYQIMLFGSTGSKQNPPVGQIQYRAYSFMSKLLWKVNAKSQVGIGIDGFYNTSLYPIIEKRTGRVASATDVMQWGANLHYGLNIGRLTTFLEFGGYIYSPQRIQGLFYHRIGLNYFMTERVIANLSLKTHFSRADYIELGIGYKLFSF